MSTSSPYCHAGIFLPYQRRAEQWAARVGAARTPFIANADSTDGFILVRSMGSNVQIVQSSVTGKLYVRKMIRDHVNIVADRPQDIRISTWNKNRPGGQLSKDSFFNQLDMWQKLDDTTFVTYFRYCNGGDLGQFTERYFEKGLRVPEHFIWHVTVELCEALAYMYFGRARGAAPGANKKDWKPIYHRDLWYDNIMLNYPPQGRGRPKTGNLWNAFPEVVIIDFGDSGLDGDPAGLLRGGHWSWCRPDDEPVVLRDWEDVYLISRILRRLAMTHIPLDPGETLLLARPETQRMANVNAAADGGTPYSDELIDFLSQFEYDGQEEDDAIAGRPDLISQVPDVAWMCDQVLPHAREQVAWYRQGMLPEPGEVLAQTLDVSWTKPIGPMPFVADHKSNTGVRALRQVMEDLADANPRIESALLELDAVAHMKPWGVTPDKEDLARPVYTTDHWDPRCLVIDARAKDRVKRGFMAQASALVSELQTISAHEACRMAVGDPPSDDDRGADRGAAFEDVPIRSGELSHRLLRRYNKALYDMQQAIGRYQRQRKNIRGVVLGEPLSDDDDYDEPAVELADVDGGHPLAAIIDAYYPDTDPDDLKPWSKVTYDPELETEDTDVEDDDDDDEMAAA